jgi:hypothetical protein
MHLHVCCVLKNKISLEASFGMQEFYRNGTRVSYELVQFHFTEKVGNGKKSHNPKEA